jgi:hypothetical protein
VFATYSYFLPSLIFSWSGVQKGAPRRKASGLHKTKAKVAAADDKHTNYNLNSFHNMARVCGTAVELSATDGEVKGSNAATR